MKMSSMYPSKYLKADDLQGRNIIVKIDRVDMEKIGDEDKPVLYFIGKEKGMVMNRTNAGNIAHVYGDDTDDWHGQEIVLFEAVVDFQGKSTPAIRVRPPQPKDRRQAAPTQRREDPISSGAIGRGIERDDFPGDRDLNDEVGF